MANNTKEIIQTNFWSGIVNDIHSLSSSAVWYAENFDIGRTKTIRPVVNNQAENACSYNVNNYITKLIQVGTDIYGLGQDGNTNNDTTLWKKTNSLSGNWGIATNGTIADSTFPGGDALLASMNGLIFFDGGNGKIVKYTISGAVLNATWKTLANGMKGGTVWQGKIWGWSGQDVYCIDPVADTLTNMKAVNSEQTIVDLVPYGNLLMIVCSSDVTISRAYLWDGVSTTTWTEILDLGLGTVSGGANLDGTIIVAIATPNKRTIKLKGYNGGTFLNLYTYTGRLNRAGTYNLAMVASKLKTFTGYIYFMITATKPDSAYAGLYEYAIARYGREEPANPMTFSVYKTLDFTSARVLDGQTANNDFTILENITGASDTAERSIAAVVNSDTKKTTFFISATNTYSGATQPGVIETYKFDGGNPAVDKSLKAVSVQYSPLPAGASVKLKYKKDDQLTWTEIFTDETDNSACHKASSVESATPHVSLPTFKEIQFRIEVIGNVELLGYKLKYEPLAMTDY